MFGNLFCAPGYRIHWKHAPNVDVVLYFVAEILPLVHSAVPAANFRIVGSNAISEIKELEKTSGVVFDTTGRKIAEGFPNNVDSIVVMLNAENAYKRFGDEDIDIFWGAYIGPRDEILIAGKLKEVIGDIERIRGEARKESGC
ncbi:MAG: precorrin synthase [Verrucomicrobiaceae bacterium]|nr:precorrin synthase [Verrucomicrobiaceae bacterium]